MKVHFLAFLLFSVVQGTWTMAVRSESKLNERVDFNCPSDDGFFGIPDTCGPDYYACIGGVAFLVTCPSGTVFDPAISTCNSPDAASCNAKFTCPESDGFFPVDPGVCSNEYYACVNFEPFLTTCPGVAVFDPIQLKCVSVETSSCAAASSTASPDSTSVITDSTINISTDTTGTVAESTITTTSPSPSTDVTSSSTASGGSSSSETITQSTTPDYTNEPVDFVCPPDNFGNGLYPYPLIPGCVAYVQCSNGNPYLVRCPTGTVFNPDALRCDYPANVPSCQTSTAVHYIF